MNDKEQLMIKKEIERTQNAVEIQEFLGSPSIEESLQILRSNEGSNIDVTVDDIKRAVHLYVIQKIPPMWYFLLLVLDNFPVLL